MSWFLNHPYTMLTVSAFVVLLIGFAIVQGRAPVSLDSSNTSYWGGGGGFLNTNLEPQGIQRTNGDSSGLFDTVQNLPPFLYVPPQQNVVDLKEEKKEFDFEAFLAELSRPRTKPTTTSTPSPSIPEEYSYVPQAIITTSEPEEERTESQEALYKYGNEAGLIIQLFEDRNRSMARVLKDQFEDPTNPEKNDALVGLGNALMGVGESLEILESVPEQTRTANARLAESYKKAGEKLALVPNALTDEEKIAAMLAYNAAAEEYVRNYISLVNIFSLARVRFSSSDPGSVFMFTASGF
ncbi:hypothetical protein C4585_02800 [Candidatus Parcubacteria bacterium]|nr:MAG: hypothetical protein C4585_02800 [Candidatus Parcubacteria bacterium]